jgi:hypothetical protein
MMIHISRRILQNVLGGLILALCLMGASFQGLSAPRIKVEQPIWNFGVVTNLTGVTNSFVIRNVGDAPLVISRVFSTCTACLIAGIDQTILPPGATTKVHGYLNLRQLSGAISRTILIECNDPQTPSCALELTGFLVPAYQTIPSEIKLDLSNGQTSGTAEIRPLFRLNAGLSVVSCDDTNLDATISPNSNTGFLLSVRVKNGLPPGNRVVNVTLRSADSNDLPCHVMVNIHHPPDLDLIPSRLIFNPQVEMQTRILWVKQHGKAPLMLLDVVPSSDKYHCEIYPDPAGVNYRIYVNARQQEAGAEQTNTLLLKFADSPTGQVRSMTVPISVGGTLKEVEKGGD